VEDACAVQRRALSALALANFAIAPVERIRLSLDQVVIDGQRVGDRFTLRAAHQLCMVERVRV
jgi:hypothetical protein